MEESEQAYLLWRGKLKGRKHSKAEIARLLKRDRGTIIKWIDDEMDKRDKTYRMAKTFKNILSSV